MSQRLRTRVARYVWGCTTFLNSSQRRAQFQPPVIPRKRTEKRDSIKPMPSSSDLTQRKIKGEDARNSLCCIYPDGNPSEKSSWYSLTRGTSGADHWRPATCKLFESDEGTTLHVYIDVSLMHIQRISCSQTPVEHHTICVDVRTRSEPYRNKTCTSVPL